METSCRKYATKASPRPWCEKGSKVLPFKSGLPSNSGLQVLSIHPLNYIRSPKTVLIVRWFRDIFEFDQPYKQAESKIK